MNTFYTGAVVGWSALCFFTSGILLPDGAAASATFQPTHKPGSVIELKGLIQNEMGSMGRVSITVYTDTAVFLTTQSSRSGRCKITLPLNQTYTIVFSVPGYVSKKIRVNAKVPSSRHGGYKFRFTIDLFEQIPGLDVSVLDEPVAIVDFNNFMNVFDYDYNYTVAINDGIKKLYRDYYALKKSAVSRK
jgi:hypothetical protein